MSRSSTQTSCATLWYVLPVAVHPHHRHDLGGCAQTKDVELKKLVYMFLSHYADHSPDCRELALMAIASYQKDMEQPNALVRGMALRVLCSIRVREIVQIQVISIKKLMRDMSPYVRKVCAHALSKVYQLDSSVKESLVDILEVLMADKAVAVLSSAIAAYGEICPDRPEVLHRFYRKFCSILADLDEWAQIAALNTLLRYARTQFVDPRKPLSEAELAAKLAKRAAPAESRKKRKSGFYSDDESMTDDEPTAADVSADDDASVLDDDHALLIRNAMQLLRSRNAGVVLAVAAVYHYLAPRSRLDSERIGRALMRVMHGHRETQYIVLTTIVRLASHYPEMFAHGLQDFFVAASEPASVKTMKVDVLASLASSINLSIILHEFTRYIRDSDKSFVCHCIRAVSRIAAAVPDASTRVMRGLMGLVKTDCSDVVAEAVVAIRQLLQKSRDINEGVVVELARMLPGISDPTARSAIVWIVGEFQDRSGIASMAPDTLRMLAKSFRTEDREVKNQVLNLAVKLHVRSPLNKAGELLYKYVMELCRYDLDYDLRDRSRQLKALVGSNQGAAHARASAVLLHTKPPPQMNMAASGVGSTDHQFGSLSFMVGHTAAGYTQVPEWATAPSDPDTRDPSRVRVKPPTAGRKALSGNTMSAEAESSSSEGDTDTDSDSDTTSSDGEGSTSGEDGSGSESESEDDGGDSSSSED
jgi:AP-3 complex subunit beta